MLIWQTSLELSEGLDKQGSQAADERGMLFAVYPANRLAFKDCSRYFKNQSLKMTYCKIASRMSSICVLSDCGSGKTKKELAAC
jgi:hypothetical protein